MYFIPLLPSVVRESLRLVISNRSSEIDHVLFHIVDCSVLIAICGFFPALGSHVNLMVFMVLVIIVYFLLSLFILTLSQLVCSNF